MQPTRLTHLTPVTAGPTLGGSVITIHGNGLGAFRRWGAQAHNARCRWHHTEVAFPVITSRVPPTHHGVACPIVATCHSFTAPAAASPACTPPQVTIPTYLDDTQLVCQTSPQPFTSPQEVALEVALNDRDYIAITPEATLRFTYFVQPLAVHRLSPTGGRVDGGTLVTIEGAGFEAYEGINYTDVRFGWGDTYASNLTTPRELSDTRVVVGSFPAAAPGERNMSLALNALDLKQINISFLYYEQPSNFTACEPTGGPTRGGTAVTIHGGPFDVFSSDATKTLCRFGPVRHAAASNLPRPSTSLAPTFHGLPSRCATWPPPSSSATLSCARRRPPTSPRS